MAKPRWVIFDDHTPVIADAANAMNLFFIASSGHGTSSDAIGIAKKVVDFLNSLPPEDTILYPFKIESEGREHPKALAGRLLYPKEPDAAP